MDALQELYIACSELQETEEALKDSDNQLFEYIKLNIAEDEKTEFFNTINSIMEIREEYFLKQDLKWHLKLCLIVFSIFLIRPKNIWLRIIKQTEPKTKYFYFIN